MSSSRLGRSLKNKDFFSPPNPSCVALREFSLRAFGDVRGFPFCGGKKGLRLPLAVGPRTSTQPAPKYHTKGCSRSSADKAGAQTLFLQHLSNFPTANEVILQDLCVIQEQLEFGH